MCRTIRSINIISFGRVVEWLKYYLSRVNYTRRKFGIYLQVKRMTFGLIPTIVTLSGCVHKITVNSNPTEADVWLINTQGPGRTALGKTPLKERVIPDTETAVIEIEKVGFLPKQVVIGLLPGAKYSIVTNLQRISPEYLAERSRKDLAQRLDQNLEELKKLQSAIAARIPEILELKELVSAQKSAEVFKQEALMKDAWSGIAIFHQLLGDFYAAQGNVVEARKRYDQALKIDPKNVDVQKRIQTLPSVGK